MAEWLGRRISVISGYPEFGSRSDHSLDLFDVFPGSTRRLHLYKAKWSASCQLGFLTC